MGGGGPIARDAQGNVIRFPSRFTIHLFFGVMVAAAGGLLFGFDNGLTGGVSEMDDFLRVNFPELLASKDNFINPNPYCYFNSQTLGLYTSCAYLTGTLAAPIAAVTTQQRGRKLSLIIGGVTYLIGALVQSTANGVAQLIIGRLILGLGVGFANQVSPLYVNEVAPAHIRGTLNLLYQLFTTFGIFLAQLINYATERQHPNGWRLSLGIQGFPGLICMIAGFFILETPNSLIERGMYEKGKRNLKLIRGLDDVDQEYNLIVSAAEECKHHQKPWKDLHSRKNAPQAVIAYLIPFFQQFTGVNVLMFYAPQIFSTLGQSNQKSLEHSIVMGLTNFLATFVAIYLVDRVGRKALFIEAGFQMCFSYVIITAVFATSFKARGTTPIPEQQVLLAFICLFVAAYAWSWGPLTFLVPPEVLTLETRSAGQAIVVGSEFIFSFVVAQAFLDMFCAMRYGVFIFFLFWCVIMTIFVWLLVPETKGIPLEAVSYKFRSHWFWKGVIKGDSAHDHHSQFMTKQDVLGALKGKDVESNGHKVRQTSIDDNNSSQDQFLMGSPNGHKNLSDQ